MAIAYPTHIRLLPYEKGTSVDYSWQVRTSVQDGVTSIWVSNNLHSLNHKDIKCRDTFLDNLLARSWEVKVSDTIEKLQRYCDELNRSEAKDEYINDRIMGSIR